jgi:hypothetical protein
MSRSRSQRLARLEQTVEKLQEERNRREAERDAALRHAALDHLTMVVAVVLHGDPRIDEPFQLAWWRAVSHLGLVGTSHPDLLTKARKILVDALPGSDLNAKFGRVLSSAPPWVLSFCMCPLDAFILGIPLQFEGQLPEPGRLAIQHPSWPSLPQGAFADGGFIPKEDLSKLDDSLSAPQGVMNAYDTLDADELMDLWQLLEKGDEKWTRLDRLRRNEIMAKVRAAHPEMDPQVIARGNKTGKHSA